MSSAGTKPVIAHLEDDSAFAHIVADILSRSGYKVVQFESKRDFLRNLNHGSEWIPDLVISDIVGSGMSGIEFLEVWKSDSFFKRIPVIMISGNAERFKQQLGDLKPFAWRSKPIDFEDLLTLVNSALK